MATFFHLIEVKFLLAAKRGHRKIKLSSLTFANDSFSFNDPYKYTDVLDSSLQMLKQGGFKVIGYGYNEKTKSYIISSLTFEKIKPIKNLSKTLGENPFKSLKVTSQKPTNQKPLKKYKRCI